MVSGTTQVVAVIGHPIAQVKSPDNFNRYFAEQHMDSVMIPVDIALRIIWLIRKCLFCHKIRPIENTEDRTD